MSLLAEFEPWWRFAFALLIGALIGMEREFYQQKRESPDFAGIRTFSLISLLGAVTAFLIDDYGVIFAVLALAGFNLFPNRLTVYGLRRTFESSTGRDAILKL